MSTYGSGNGIVPLPPEHGNSQNNLRARIVAAIAKADQDWCSDNNLHEDMADAVIQELGLQEERDRPYSTRHDWQGDWRYRYVTEWEAG